MNLNILSFNLDTRILDPQSATAERERKFEGRVQKYTLLVPYSRDTEISLTKSITAYGVGGSTKLIQLVNIYRKATLLARRYRYDVLTVQDTYYLAIVGWLVARRYNLGFEIQVHGFEKFSGLRAMLAKKIIPKADSIRAASVRLKNLLITQFNIPEEKITVAPLFSESKPIFPQSESDKKISKQNDFIFLTVARLVPVKNIALQIDGFKNVLARHPDTQLWIVGDGPERVFLEKKVKDLGMSDKVIFWGWHADVSFFYSHADSYLLSSDSEGWGLVIFEAASYGLPILMTNVGCAEEFIYDGKNGLIVPPGDAKAFEEGMLKLREQKPLRESLGNAAQDSLATLPSKDELILRYVASWKKALNN